MEAAHEDHAPLRARIGSLGPYAELVEILLAYGGYPAARERFWRTVIAAEVGNAGARMRGDSAPPIRARESAIGRRSIIPLSTGGFGRPQTSG